MDAPTSPEVTLAPDALTSPEAAPAADPVSGASPSAPTPETSPTPDAAPAPWWTRSTVYQIWPRSFADSNGDGIGDVPGITAHLDHLADLGVDVVWLSPVYRSPQDDYGYDIADYRDVDPLFGTLADLDELIAKARERGIGVMMDLVVNHTSDEHAWFTASRSSREDPQRDWYIWRPPRPGAVGGRKGAEPNDWPSLFGGSAWEWDEATGEYYLHLFSRRQPDLNWENPRVRAAVYDMMGWWLDRGVAGFRMDVINMISKTPADLVAAGPAAFPVNGPRLHEFLAEMHREVFDPRPRTFVTVGEMPMATPEVARLVTDPARAELDMVFQFEHVNVDQAWMSKWNPTPLRLTALKSSLARWQEALAERGWNSLYFCNHDQPRVVARWGDLGEHRVRSAKTIATTLHMMRGTPYVYQGEEIGMAGAVLDGPGDLRDIEALNFYREQVAAGADPEGVMARIRPMCRDNARTPVQWTPGPNAGFCAPSAEPWIAVNPDHTEVNVEAQVGDPASVLAHYRSLIALRRTDATVALGDFRLLAADDEALFAYMRTRGADRLLVLANWSPTDLAVTGLGPDVPGDWAETGRVVLGTDLPAGAAPGRDALGPWESVVVRLEA